MLHTLDVIVRTDVLHLAGDGPATCLDDPPKLWRYTSAPRRYSANRPLDSAARLVERTGARPLRPPAGPKQRAAISRLTRAPHASVGRLAQFSQAVYDQSDESGGWACAGKSAPKQVRSALSSQFRHRKSGMKSWLRLNIAPDDHAKLYPRMIRRSAQAASIGVWYRAGPPFEAAPSRHKAIAAEFRPESRIISRDRCEDYNCFRLAIFASTLPVRHRSRWGARSGW